VNPGVGIGPPAPAQPQIAGAGRICPVDYRYRMAQAWPAAAA
jgi:hypothetical protein